MISTLTSRISHMWHDSYLPPATSWSARFPSASASGQSPWFSSLTSARSRQFSPLRWSHSTHSLSHSAHRLHENNAVSIYDFCPRRNFAIYYHEAMNLQPE
ncbi:hypothetical protein PV10_07390 [Exophiala mesophila]|uniref:Uncharacterized protein n=1 Tax=Exophiala mesophila TaxID=212818 RepID=A0A0D1XPM8_EXOME|nr:uncharacterized protein PV10_07390 [Exophiala mesophila]KIV90046.1 hypothetical protein PV10_07390 [Exophiala mesophila]